MGEAEHHHPCGEGPGSGAWAWKGPERGVGGYAALCSDKDSPWAPWCLPAVLSSTDMLQPAVSLKNWGWYKSLLAMEVEMSEQSQLQVGLTGCFPKRVVWKPDWGFPAGAS